MLLAAPAADSARAAEKARPAERGVARQRPVAVAFEHLDPPSGNVPARIGVELFDGMIVVVDFVRIDRRGPGNYTWHGRVDGYDKSEAVLTVVDGNIAGTISLVDSAARITATYQLQTNRDGTQSLRQIDQSGFPTDHPPGSEKLRAPVQEKAAPRGSRGDIELKGGAIAAADTGAIIDVMIVYSKQTAAAAGTAIGAQIQQAIDSANAAYANSGITTRLRPGAHRRGQLRRERRLQYRLESPDFGIRRLHGRSRDVAQHPRARTSSACSSRTASTAASPGSAPAPATASP